MASSLPPGPRPPVGGSSWLPLWGWGRAPGCSLHQRAAPRWAPEHRNTWKRTQPKSGPGPLAVGIWSWIVPRHGAVLSIIWSITESLGSHTQPHPFPSSNSSPLPTSFPQQRDNVTEKAACFVLFTRIVNFLRLLERQKYLESSWFYSCIYVF